MLLLVVVIFNFVIISQMILEKVECPALVETLVEISSRHYTLYLLLLRCTQPRPFNVFDDVCICCICYQAMKCEWKWTINSWAVYSFLRVITKPQY